MKSREFMLWGIAFLFHSLTVLWSGDESYADLTAETTGEIRMEQQARSGHGENFEIIIKYPAVKPESNTVSLVAYVLDIATNEPIKGAVLSGSLSSGNESVAVAFTETKNGPPGAYDGKVHVQTDKPYSWLLDISHGEKSDLVAIDGFLFGDGNKPASLQTASEPKKTGYGITLTPVRIILLICAFIVFQVAVVYLVRKRSVSGISGKGSR